MSSSNRRRPQTPEQIPEVQRARALAAIDARLAQLKDSIAKASLSCLRGAPDAAARVRDALIELEGARTLLAAAEPEE